MPMKKELLRSTTKNIAIDRQIKRSLVLKKVTLSLKKNIKEFYNEPENDDDY